MTSMPGSAKGERNLLEMVPERNREWVAAESGEVRVLEPRYGRSAAGRWLAARVARPNIEIKLDELGSAVWRACDGRTSVGQIADGLREEFGDRIEPATERLARFFRGLERTKFIRWRSGG
jgi:Coenzyme PQQ synthesis protein D (PqqD)